MLIYGIIWTLMIPYVWNQYIWTIIELWGQNGLQKNPADFFSRQAWQRSVPRGREGLPTMVPRERGDAGNPAGLYWMCSLLGPIWGEF